MWMLFQVYQQTHTGYIIFILISTHKHILYATNIINIYILYCIKYTLIAYVCNVWTKSLHFFYYFFSSTFLFYFMTYSNGIVDYYYFFISVTHEARHHYVTNNNSAKLGDWINCEFIKIVLLYVLAFNVLLNTFLKS